MFLGDAQTSWYQDLAGTNTKQDTPTQRACFWLLNRPVDMHIHASLHVCKHACRCIYTILYVYYVHVTRQKINTRYVYCCEHASAETQMSHICWNILYPTYYVLHILYWILHLYIDTHAHTSAYASTFTAGYTCVYVYACIYIYTYMIK